MLLSVDTMVQCQSHLLALCPGRDLETEDFTSAASRMSKLSPTKTSVTVLPGKVLLNAKGMP